MRTDLSIIIVNWRSKDYLRKCLHSLFAHTRGLSFEVIVVDSASYDGCGEMLAREFPAVRFIQCDKNVGFAKANNLGYAQSCGDSLLFLNPDTDLTSPAVGMLHASLSSLDNPGIIGARLLNSDRTLQTTSIQAFPNLLNQLFDAEMLRRRFPRLSLWGMAPLFAASKNPAQVQAVSGACMMVRRRSFERVGKFSEDYFMYSEDVDLCYKASQCGFKNYYVPAAEIIHHGGCSSGRQSAQQLSNVMLRESRWRYFMKTRGLAYAITFRITLFLAAIVRLSLAMPGLLFGRTQEGFPCKAACRKWIAIAQWCVGLQPVASQQAVCPPQLASAESHSNATD